MAPGGSQIKLVVFWSQSWAGETDEPGKLIGQNGIGSSTLWTVELTSVFFFKCYIFLSLQGGLRESRRHGSLPMIQQYIQ